MSKSSVQKVRSAAKNARVSAKKSAKPKSVSRSAAKSARRATSGKLARGHVKAAKPVSKSAAKPINGKTVGHKALAQKALPQKGLSKAGLKTVRSIAEAMKAAKVARLATSKGRISGTTAAPPVQPVIEVKTHKFEIGQVVYYNAPTFGRAPAPGNFTVVKLLPSEGDEQQYRIKSNGEAFERVAKESQLDMT
jgi:hypothetical protein